MTNMKRICIIGDSHVAALKNGWTTLAIEYPGVELTFFAAGSQHMEALAVGGNAVVATTPQLRKRLKITSSGQTEINGSYDAYAICGLGMNCTVAAQIHKILLAVQRGAELSQANRNDTLVKTIAESLQLTMSIRVLDMVRQITNAAAVLVPQPLRAEDDTPTPDDPSKSMRWIQAPFQMVCERLAKERKASFLPQPVETISDTLLATKAKYAIAPSRLSANESKEDRSHMNGEYGAIVLRKALGVLAFAPIQDAAR